MEKDDFKQYVDTQDLLRVGRNTDMLDPDELAEEVGV